MKQKIEDTVRDYMSTRKIANTVKGRQQIEDEIHRRMDFKYPVPIIGVSLDDTKGVFTVKLEVPIYETEA